MQLPVELPSSNLSAITKAPPTYAWASLPSIDIVERELFLDESSSHSGYRKIFSDSNPRTRHQKSVGELLTLLFSLRVLLSLT